MSLILKQIKKGFSITLSNHKSVLVLCGSLLSSIATPTIAQSGHAAQDSLDVVVVSATRTEKRLSEIPNTVSVIDDKQIEREIANNIDDLVRYEPGVSVPGSGRFGLSSFSIRGIGGDRVLTLVDSTPTADEFSFGPFLSSRRNFVDIDALKSVEIVRGPSSSVYGSNAIGGVVNFITKDPVDYLGKQSFAGSAKVGYSSVDQSTNTTVLAAFGNSVWSGMVLGTLRDASETETFFGGNVRGPERQAQNPQQIENQNIYAKLVYQPNDIHRVSVVAERFTGESETDVLSSQGTFSRGVLVNSENGVDERSRERLSIDYRLNLETAFFDSLSLLAYTQDSDAEQDTFSERLSRGLLQNRTRNSFYQQENYGFRVQLNKQFASDNTSHEVTYGIDYDESDSVTLREGRTISALTGAVLPEFSNFPTRDFPNSEYTSVGAFIQDDISLLDGRLHIIPGVRYDSFELDPTADAIYLSGNTGSPVPEGYDESELSAKIGLVYDLSDSWSVSAQYAEGFRAPPLDAVNTGFTNFAGGYTTLPNANLRPERGESVELGLRHTGEAGVIELAVYQNRYEDFIESLALIGFNPVTRLLEFQARNLDEAEIEGVELKARYDLGRFSSRLEGVNLRAAYAYAKGENTQSNDPINSIDPQQLVLGIGYNSANDVWGVETVVTLVDRKNASDIDASSLQARGEPQVAPFETAGFATVDLIGHYYLNEQTRINWGVFNATDKKHFQWSEELVQNPLTTNFDRLTEPGRNYSITIKYNF